MQGGKQHQRMNGSLWTSQEPRTAEIAILWNQVSTRLSNGMQWNTMTDSGKAEWDANAIIITLDAAEDWYENIAKKSFNGWKECRYQVLLLFPLYIQTQTHKTKKNKDTLTGDSAECVCWLCIFGMHSIEERGFFTEHHPKLSNPFRGNRRNMMHITLVR